MNGVETANLGALARAGQRSKSATLIGRDDNGARHEADEKTALRASRETPSACAARAPGRARQTRRAAGAEPDAAP
ncbi:hypothetical protein, partial [Burkholderia pseudomallei]|uniref:hypothetical protein n=1 Tax=Burkholderia pseudomallei TaxID=28450 RepID=UPI001E4F91A0